MSNKFNLKMKKYRNSAYGFLYFLFFININFSFGVDLNPSLNLSPNTHLSTLKIHAFHTSITQLEYNAKNKTYEVSVRIFSDDFARAIDLQNHTKNTIIQDGDKNDKVVFDYVNKHFAIFSPKNKKINLKFIGKENEDLATWIYIEIPAENFVKGAKIQQNVMMELFEDQINIVNIKKGEERKSFLFNIKNKVKELL
jgi:hypothetical protein